MSQALHHGRSLLCAGAVLCVALAGAATARAADEHINMQAGNWEMTISMEMPGMPNMKPVVTTHCSKGDQIKDAGSFAAMMQERNRGKCKISDIKMDGNRLAYSYACESNGSGTADFTFAGGSYEGTMKMTVAGRQGGDPMTVTQHIKGKRLGDC